MDEYEKQVVLQHELIHYQKRHSLDLLVLEVFHSLFWINPLFFYLKKELVNIHEFEVDQEMYKTHKTNYMRHLLNYALGSVDSHYLLTSPFYNRLTITKRIQTMKNNKNKNNFWLLLTIPALAIGINIISCENQSIKEEPKKNYTQVLQGQKDAGIELDASNQNKQPEFKGGVEAMYKFLGENVNYPESAKNEKVEGKVLINFTVNLDGTVAFVKVLKGISKELDDEAVRVVKTCQNGILRK
jgi:TonB family protein